MTTATIRRTTEYGVPLPSCRDKRACQDSTSDTRRVAMSFPCGVIPAQTPPDANRQLRLPSSRASMITHGTLSLPIPCIQHQPIQWCHLVLTHTATRSGLWWHKSHRPDKPMQAFLFSNARRTPAVLTPKQTSKLESYIRRYASLRLSILLDHHLMV